MAICFIHQQLQQRRRRPDAHSDNVVKFKNKGKICRRGSTVRNHRQTRPGPSNAGQPGYPRHVPSLEHHGPHTADPWPPYDCATTTEPTKYQRYCNMPSLQLIALSTNVWSP
nr:uncharacterized protein LOC129384796 [Dermacentor andersoni]